MAKRVRRTHRVKSRLKTLKNLQDAPKVGSAQNVPIDADGSDVGPHGLTGSLRVVGKKRARRKSGVGAGDDGSSIDLDGAGETARETVQGVTRRGGGGLMGGDGFDSGENARAAYEAYLRGNIEADAERFEALRQEGARDTFDPNLSPAEVEERGHLLAAGHVVRLLDQWFLESPDRTAVIERAAGFLVGFSRPESVRKVLAELESKPIRDVYPLEVLLRILETHPEKLPGVEMGSVLGGLPTPGRGQKVFAGHPFSLRVPDDVRLKAFALLGGARPGYEFYPSTKAGHYTMQVDTPGEWEFAVLAVRTEKLGKMVRERPGAVVERFVVKVEQMGRKEASA